MGTGLNERLLRKYLPPHTDVFLESQGSGMRITSVHQFDGVAELDPHYDDYMRRRDTRIPGQRWANIIAMGALGVTANHIAEILNCPASNISSTKKDIALFYGAHPGTPNHRRLAKITDAAFRDGHFWVTKPANYPIDETVAELSDLNATGLSSADLAPYYIQCSPRVFDTRLSNVRRSLGVPSEAAFVLLSYLNGTLAWDRPEPQPKYEGLEEAAVPNPMPYLSPGVRVVFRRVETGEDTAYVAESIAMQDGLAVINYDQKTCTGSTLHPREGAALLLGAAGLSLEEHGKTFDTLSSLAALHRLQLREKLGMKDQPMPAVTAAAFDQGILEVRGETPLRFAPSPQLIRQLKCLALGMTHPQIVNEMAISRLKVADCFKEVHQRLETERHSELVLWGYLSGLLPSS